MSVSDVLSSSKPVSNFASFCWDSPLFSVNAEHSNKDVDVNAANNDGV